ncbi:MAG: hypothetical protein ACYC7C_05185 [Coriobacteriia bacterium]
MTASETATAAVWCFSAVSTAAAPSSVAGGLGVIDTITVAALGLNVVALAFAGYQSLLGRKALESTEESLVLSRKALESTEVSLALSRKAMHIQMLPHANWAIRVQVDLDRWIGDLESSMVDAITARRENDAALLRSVAKRALKSPAGLVSRFGYEHAPEWLSTVWVAGAQYYYDAAAAQGLVWDDRDDSPRFDSVHTMSIRWNDSLHGLRELRTMIDDMVPRSYLESPASVNDEDFLG